MAVFTVCHRHTNKIFKILKSLENYKSLGVGTEQLEKTKEWSAIAGHSFVPLIFSKI